MAKRKVTKIRKVKGINQDGTPNAFWKKFKAKLALYDQEPVSDWTEVNLLGHLLKRYRDYMGTEYTFQYNSAPGKCRELYCIKRTISLLDINDNQKIKDYIDFVYDTYIIPSKVTINTLAYFFTANFIFEFKKKLHQASIVRRTSELPPPYKKVLSDLGIDLATYGDLAFAKVAIDNDPNNSDLGTYVSMFSELKTIGFDIGVLERLDGN